MTQAHRKPLSVPELILESGACISSSVDMTPSPSNRSGFHEPAYLAALEAARKVCAGCTVREPCRAWGIDQANIVAGMVGGLTQQERQRRKWCHA